MYLGQIEGTVVATHRVVGLEGAKFLLVQPLDEDRNPAGPKEVAVDTVQAGIGDFVYLVGSREATLALENTFVPVDAAVIGIVDDLHRTVES
ncbi:MAG: EutN/CcmL family microcompartment protein [Deltaproteobacteria bacterium]|jgi:ethanolamine utilization protein EutN|nr:EutN/CcmL family microcompartment protein [Deltaproteobacteria bacterium]MBT6435142.1 EutN/CcmL family microcompartment protein [Deltaproteobacteria bacterium]MBT6488608.1 EutN/CcmL family microcompartment protein [Deltaproteobacteria bacterium]